MHVCMPSSPLPRPRPEEREEKKNVEDLATAMRLRCAHTNATRRNAEPGCFQGMCVCLYVCMCVWG